MRPTFAATLTGLLGLSLAPYPSLSASASCAAPMLFIEGHQHDHQPLDLHPGEEVTVSGRGFVDGCDDVGEGSSAFGCSGEDASEKPLEDVELVALQGRSMPNRTSLATADAGSADGDRLGWISWSFTVPASLEPGAAVLKTVGSEPLRVRIGPPVVVD